MVSDDYNYKLFLLELSIRHRKMRKQLKRQIAAALAVQRVFRGFLIRSRIKRKKSLNNNEENQDERLNRLRFTILSFLPFFFIMIISY
jgi:hypothetical protein